MKMYSRIKEELSLQGKTQKWLSIETGIPGSHISEFLNGNRSFKLEKLEKIATVLDLKWVLVDKTEAIKSDIMVLLGNYKFNVDMTGKDYRHFHFFRLRLSELINFCNEHKIKEVVTSSFSTLDNFIEDSGYNFLVKDMSEVEIRNKQRFFKSEQDFNEFYIKVIEPLEKILD